MKDVKIEPVHEGEYRIRYIGLDAEGRGCIIFASEGHADLKVRHEPDRLVIGAATVGDSALYAS